MQFSTLTDRFAEYVPQLMATVPVALAIWIGAVLLNLVLGRMLNVLGRHLNLAAIDIFPVHRILRWIVWLVALVLVLSVFGFQIGGIWAVLSTVFGLIAIGFVAVWSLISHSTATVLMLFLRPFQVGDDIEFVGEEVRGRVVDLNFFYTTLIDHEGLQLKIPNNLFFQRTIKRRVNANTINLAVQLNARTPANLGLPPPPRKKGESKEAPAQDPLLNVADPRTLTPPETRPGR